MVSPVKIYVILIMEIFQEKTFVRGKQQGEEKMYYFSKKLLSRGKIIDDKKEVPLIGII